MLRCSRATPGPSTHDCVPGLEKHRHQSLPNAYSRAEIQNLDIVAQRADRLLSRLCDFVLFSLCESSQGERRGLAPILHFADVPSRIDRVAQVRL